MRGLTRDYSDMRLLFECQAEDEIDEVNLTENEMSSGYSFEFVNPSEILQEDSNRPLAGKVPCLFERERRILLQLVSEGMFEDEDY